jgi:hypothetical protein
MTCKDAAMLAAVLLSCSDGGLSVTSLLLCVGPCLHRPSLDVSLQQAAAGFPCCCVFCFVLLSWAELTASPN